MVLNLISLILAGYSLYRSRGYKMALETDILSLRDKLNSLATTISEEVSEVQAAVQALKDRVAQLEGIDLSAELANLDSAIAGVEAISDAIATPQV